MEISGWGKIKENVICSSLAVLIGLAMGVIGGVFGCALEFVADIRVDRYAQFTPFLGFAGILIIFMYKKISPRSQQGMEMVIAYEMGELSEKSEIKDYGKAYKIGKFPKAFVILKIVSNVIMQLFGASTGKEGTIAQCGAAIADYVSRAFNCRKYSQILLIAGVSGAVSSIFQTPLGGMFFALEFIAAGVMFYNALIPSFISAFTASWVAQFLGYHAYSVDIAISVPVTGKSVFMIVISSIIFGLLGRIFIRALHDWKKLSEKIFKNPYVRIFVFGSIMAMLILFVHDGLYAGTGEKMMKSVLNGDGYHVYDFALKLIFTVVCVGVGFTGGEMMPLMAIGVSAGAALSGLTGLPLELSAVMGCIGVYTGATNTLVSPIFIGIAMFGGDTATYMAVASVIAYAVNGNHSIYHGQRTLIASMYGVLKKTD